MKITTFEDLPIWQDARELAKVVCNYTAHSSFRDFSLRDQMKRAAASVSSNIAEGFERGSNRELIQFLYITKGSLGELRSQIYLASDSAYIEQEDADILTGKCTELSKGISNFIRYLKDSPITASRHKEK